MRLPDFLIIGAAKSGTTTLDRYLSLHPQVYMVSKKQVSRDLNLWGELNFFSFDDRYARGLDWYASLFSKASPHQVCGEASTDYAKFPEFPECARRIWEAIPNVKLIYIMRHPVDRAYSYYVHLGRGSKYKETFEEHIKKSTVCLDGSNYMMQIEQYLKFFPKESFLFLLFDDLKNNSDKIQTEVNNFLEIENLEITESDNLKANSARKFFEDTIRAKITKPLRSMPLVSTMAGLCPQAWRDSVYEILQSSFYGKSVKAQYSPKPMLPETRKMLIEKFREPNQKLAEFIDRDLSHWSK